MRRIFLVAATVLSAFLPAVAVSAQAAQTGPQNISQALKANYDRAVKAKDWLTALGIAQQLVNIEATSAHLFLLANAQLYAAVAQHNTAGVESSLATDERALTAAKHEKPAESRSYPTWKDGMAKIYTGKGNALLELRRNAEAVDAYRQAAGLSSTPGVSYFNICAVLYNTGDVQNGIDACRKAAAVNPARADTWFVLGSLLYMESKGNASAAHGKFVISAECRQALEKYLQLAPDGPHAADVKAMLEMAAK